MKVYRFTILILSSSILALIGYALSQIDEAVPQPKPANEALVSLTASSDQSGILVNAKQTIPGVAQQKSKPAQENLISTSEQTENSREKNKADLSKRFLAEQASFKALDAQSKYERRTSSLAKLIGNQPLDIADQVALAPKLGTRREVIERAKRLAEAQIDVNGLTIDVTQHGIVVANRIAIYVPPNDDRILSDLRAMSGVSAVEPVFKGELKQRSAADKRDPKNWYHVTLPAEPEKVKTLVKALNQFPEVGVAEATFERRFNVDRPLVSDLNDPLKIDQWHLEEANVPAAWAHLEQNDLPAGGLPLVVAVIDSGVDYNHPDLKENMWVNNQETPGNGIDDDNNGFIDDIHGAAVVGENFSHSGDPADDHGHGTHVAGIIAATGGNGEGGVGVAYNSKIMAIKAGQYSGVLTTVDIAEAIYYAVDNGADVINMSFGGYGRSLVEEDALSVAFSQAVLVSSAGNAGKANQLVPEKRCFGAVSYPAGYPWVVGVMAHAKAPATNGDWLTGFSNWDCIDNNQVEYEVMAPGVGIWSPLPTQGYGNWSGTSMASPIVAGIAALARTKWPDKTAYSSRFIMGQIAATGAKTSGVTPPFGGTRKYSKVDALTALTTAPAPKLNFEKLWVFDEPAVSTINDGDGSLDAGETIELAIVIRNRWGKADNVQATLSTPSGASTADPYITLDTATVNYGAVGSFNKDDNGLIFDDGLLVIGVSEPFVLSVSADTPNNHIVPFTLTMTASNGLDSSDTKRYEFKGKFELVVQSGRELPSVIDGDAIGSNGGALDSDGVVDGVVTLDDSALWIVSKPVLVAESTTLKLGPGAQLQFWSSEQDSAYSNWQHAKVQVEGRFESIGTADNPVHMFPNALFPNRGVDIFTAREGKLAFEYNNIVNPVILGESDRVNFNYFYRDFTDEVLRIRGGSATDMSAAAVYVPRGIGGSNMQDGAPVNPDIKFTGNRFKQLASWPKYSAYSQEDSRFDAWDWDSFAYTQSLFDSVAITGVVETKDSVFLKNHQTKINDTGKTIYKTTTLRGLGPKLSHVVISTFELAEKTYALLHQVRGQTMARGNYSPFDYDENARKLAATLGGYLYTVSSKEESEAVSEWLAEMSSRSLEEWLLVNEKCPESLLNNFCTDLGYLHVGLLLQSDGSYVWDSGEIPEYDWLTEQLLREEGAADDFGQPLGTINGSNGNLRLLSFQATAEQQYYSFPKTYLLEIPGSQNKTDLEEALNSSLTDGSTSRFTRNAILSNWRDLNPMHWLSIESHSGEDNRNFNFPMDISGNYWGGAGSEVVDIVVTDRSDDFNMSKAVFNPVLTTAPETAYPFVVSVALTRKDGSTPADLKFGQEETTWSVTFNRDMDQSKQPLVTFGPDLPFTDFIVAGDWVDARTWVGSFKFSATSGDGLQNIRIAGAVAADNPWLVTGDDSERFWFELVTSGIEALNLQASGERDQVLLSWTQDDFELLHGFNIYRSLSEDGAYERINASTVNKSESTFIDRSISPGVPHYYYFTVMSDTGESETRSNLAVATPVDTILPTLSHSAETVALYKENLTIRAQVTDNIMVSSVTLYFRSGGDSNWVQREMIATASSRYSATIEGAQFVGESLEYYIQVKDGQNTVYFASNDAPQIITVSYPNGTDSDGDGVTNADDALPGNANESVDTDNDGTGNNADLDDDNDGISDEEELADGTDPLSRFSCRSGCFSFDVDESLQAQPLTDGLLVIRHLFGFSGDSLTSGAVSGEAGRDSSEAIAGYLTDAETQLDIDGDGESKPLTDGLLLIRYLFGFSGDSLISGAIGSGAERDTADEVEAYIKERVPAE